MSAVAKDLHGFSGPVHLRTRHAPEYIRRIESGHWSGVCIDPRARRTQTWRFE